MAPGLRCCRSGSTLGLANEALGFFTTAGPPIPGDHHFATPPRNPKQARTCARSAAILDAGLPDWMLEPDTVARVQQADRPHNRGNIAQVTMGSTGGEDGSAVQLLSGGHPRGGGFRMHFVPLSTSGTVRPWSGGPGPVIVAPRIYTQGLDCVVTRSSYVWIGGGGTPLSTVGRCTSVR